MLRDGGTISCYDSLPWYGSSPESLSMVQIVIAKGSIMGPMEYSGPT